MEYRNLNLVIVSAKSLKKTTFIGKMDVYAVATISGTVGNSQKIKTRIDKHAGSNPTWNFPMKFVVNEAAGLQNCLTLVVKIKAAGFFGGRNLGEVNVPVKELLEGVKPEGKTVQFVSYQVIRPSGKPKGVLSFSYEFGEKFTGKPEEPVTAYPPPAYVRTGGYGYQQQQQPGYGYYPPAPGYGGYPPPPATVVPPQQSRMGNSGMGFGTGLLGGALGGMLIGEMMSGGGGCGGGGCGGCGGGGCGGF